MNDDTFDQSIDFPESLESIPLEQIAKIEEICTLFEQSWLNSKEPSIEIFLSMTAESSQIPLLRELLLLDVFYRRKFGLRHATDEYESRFPKHKNLIRYAISKNLELDSESPLLNKVGRYRIKRKIAQGGMGIVFEALDNVNGRVVTLKVLPPKLDQYYSAVERFRAEFEAAVKVSHTNVVNAIEFATEHGLQYIAMEFVRGVNLLELVHVGSVDVANGCDIVKQAALGLHAVHQAGLVHCDVKPSNLMLTFEGVVKVMDLGMARPIGPVSASGSLRIAGTPVYLPPEQWNGPEVFDPRSDLYSLGCTFFFLFSGEPPFQVDRFMSMHKLAKAHLELPFPSIRHYRPEVSYEIDQIIRKLTNKKPSDRFGSAADVAKALEPYCKGSDLKKLAVNTRRQIGAKRKSTTNRLE